MQANELKAVLTRTKEFAIYPAHVEDSPPEHLTRRTRYGTIVCPSGLTRATIIDNGYPWIERRPVSQCGDQDYEISRRNGVLVEIDPDDLKLQYRHVIVGNKLYTGKKKRNQFPYPHTEIITRDGKKFIHMITSRKAIIAAWNEYAIIEAQREKERKEAEERISRLINAQAALMGVHQEFLNSDTMKREVGYLQSGHVHIYEVGSDGRHIYVDGEPRIRAIVGHVSITIDQAEKILGLLTKTQLNKLSKSQPTAKGTKS